MKTQRVPNVRACEKLLSAVRCVREHTGSSRICTCGVVSTAAAAYTAGLVYTCIPTCCYDRVYTRNTRYCRGIPLE